MSFQNNYRHSQLKSNDDLIYINEESYILTIGSSYNPRNDFKCNCVQYMLKIGDEYFLLRWDYDYGFELKKYNYND